MRITLRTPGPPASPDCWRVHKINWLEMLLVIVSDYCDHVCGDWESAGDTGSQRGNNQLLLSGPTPSHQESQYINPNWFSHVIYNSPRNVRTYIISCPIKLISRFTALAKSFWVLIKYRLTFSESLYQFTSTLLTFWGRKWMDFKLFDS